MILTEVSEIWGPIKHAVEKSIHLSPDAVHIHVGVALLFFFAWATKRPLHDWRPWMMMFLLEGINEIVDLNQKYGSTENNVGESIHDIVNTLFLPTLLLLYYRFRHRRQQAEMERQALEQPAE